MFMTEKRRHIKQCKKNGGGGASFLPMLNPDGGPEIL